MLDFIPEEGVLSAYDKIEVSNTDVSKSAFTILCAALAQIVFT